MKPRKAYFLFLILAPFLLFNCNRITEKDIEKAQAKLDTPAGKVIARHFEVTGGLRKHMELRSKKMLAREKSRIGTRIFHEYTKAPDKRYTASKVDGEVSVHNAHDGDMSWSYDKQSGYQVYQNNFLSKRIAERAEFESPFINADEKGHHFELMEPETIAGQTYDLIKLSKYYHLDRKNVVYYFLFNQETGLMSARRFILDDEPNVGTVEEMWYKDYQPTEYGLMMPYRIEFKNNGKLSFTYLVKKYIINENIDDEIFEIARHVNIN